MEIPNEFNDLVSIVYNLIKVRGIKNVKKYLGHKTEDFAPVLFFMISADTKIRWESVYFLFIWFSVVLLVPFDFKRLDSIIIEKYYSQNYT